MGAEAGERATHLMAEVWAVNRNVSAKVTSAADGEVEG